MKHDTPEFAAIAEPWLTWLRDLRRGKHTQDEAVAAGGRECETGF